MKAYIICIISTIFFVFLSERSFKDNKTMLGKIFLLIALFIPCFVAGVRSDSIGTDIKTYLIPLYKHTQLNNFTIFREYKNTGLELGFITIVYLATIICSNLNFVFFIIELAISVPIFLYSYLQRNNKSMIFTILIFLLTMYCNSLTMMRQSIAISLILLSTYFLEKENYKKTFLLYIIAILFHQSAAIGILIYIPYYIIKKYNKNKIPYLSLLFAIILIFCLLITILLPYLPFKYVSYLSKNNATAVNLLSFIKKIIWILPLLLCMDLTKNKKSNYYDLLIFSLFLILLDCAFYLTGIKLPIVSRVSLYFSNILYFILLPLFQIKIKPKIVTNLILVLLIFAFWWHMTAIDNNSSGIYPYRSDIIEFLN